MGLKPILGPNGPTRSCGPFSPNLATDMRFTQPSPIFTTQSNNLSNWARRPIGPTWPLSAHRGPKQPSYSQSSEKYTPDWRLELIHAPSTLSRRPTQTSTPYSERDQPRKVPLLSSWFSLFKASFASTLMLASRCGIPPTSEFKFNTNSCRPLLAK